MASDRGGILRGSGWQYKILALDRIVLICFYLFGCLESQLQHTRSSLHHPGSF